MPAASNPEPRPALPAALSGHIGFLSARMHKVFVAAADEALEPLGLVVKQFGLLTVIASEGPLSQGELGHFTQIDRTTMVSLVDELERAGYVDRRRDPKDRRAYALVVTEGGRDVQKKAAGLLDGAQAKTLAPLSLADQAALKKLMHTVILGSQPPR